jgi:hypothetical protein
MLIHHRDAAGHRSPWHRSSVVHGRFAIALALVTLVATSPSLAQAPHPRFPVTNGAVTALAISGNTLYVGGSFDMIGPVTGGGVPVDTAAGAPAVGYPQVTGSVYAAVADGAGGWFVAGEFNRVGAEPRANLAHIRSDFSVDSWNPGTNGPIFALVLIGQTLYVGGDFTILGGQSRGRFAAVDASTGDVAPWAADADGAVRAIVFHGRALYLGGAFTSIAGQSRRHLAAIDAPTGQVLWWNPDPDGSVLCLAVADDILYAGGDFIHVGRVTRYHIAAFEFFRGGVTPWNGTANGRVTALAVSGGKVYVGGNFSRIGGQARSGLAALSTRWWQAVDWNPGAVEEWGHGGPGSGTVTTLAIQGDRLYVGGAFSSIGGQSRMRAAALDTTTGHVAAWDPRAGGAVSAIAPSGPRIYLGGSFPLIGGSVRHGMAAIDRTTERVTPWSPLWNSTRDLDERVTAIACAGPMICIGGRIGPGSAAAVLVDSATGNLVASKYNEYQTYCLAASESTFFWGTESGEGPDLAAFRAESFSSPRWSVNASYFRYYWDQPLRGTVLAAGYSEGRVVVAGFFRYVDNVPCPKGLAILDARTGQLIHALDVPTFGSVSSVTAQRGIVYAGAGLKAYDAETGEPLSWPQRSVGVSGLACAGNRLYLAGSFREIDGEPRNCLAAVDRVTGELLDWAPTVSSNPGVADGYVSRVVSADGVVYIGGGFGWISGEMHPYLAAITDLDQLVGAPPVGTRTSASLLLTADPNPFAVGSTVRFLLPRAGRASLVLLDRAGRRVRTLVDRADMIVGRHEFALRRDGLAAGIYWLELVADGSTARRRIVILP